MMPEFLKLTPRDIALQILLVNLPVRTSTELIRTEHALGRVTAQPVTTKTALPPFNRSTVDGYAVQAADTYGASESLPAYLRLVGEVPMGGLPPFDLSTGQVQLIHTGGMLPTSADAVVMLEQTQSAGEMIEVHKAVALGENVIKAGEDVQPGEQVIPAGWRLRAQEIGGLAAIGITEIKVAVPPRVGILSSGDEIVPPEVEPLPGQVRDANSYFLSALVTEAGGVPIRYGIFPDQIAPLTQAAERAIQDCDVVVFTAGSSASARDLTAQVINRLGSPGILVHGVGVRPGKPTILAICREKAVIGLPGNPVSAFVIARLFLAPVIERLLGLSTSRPKPGFSARLKTNLASQAGREDWVPVRLIATPHGWLAEPIFSKSNLIFSLVRADGLVRVPPDATGLAANDIVWVVALD
jgi:molybdopterin molybdotransferase